MILHEHHHLECIIPEKNRAAYYRLVAGRDLFGYKLIRCWGRIGAGERPRLFQRFETLEEMEKSIRRILKIRRSHGYRPSS
jgi:predicted DNA-binding WGR domain protein